MSLYYPSPGSDPDCLRDYQVLYDIDDWHEDFGPVVWWRCPIEEAPWVGTPLDDDFIENYYTHWSKLLVPPSPEEYKKEVSEIAASWTEEVRKYGR